jgi:hypothetical protein
MFNWLREYLELRLEFQERRRVCQSCETLKYEIERLRAENSTLLNHVLQKPEPVPERTMAPQPLTIPKRVPWAVKRQMLEAEDREKARILRQAPKPDAELEELEREMDIAAQSREAENASTK